jgi:hypothetical protein
MLMHEFNRRFAAKDEMSSLFEILRRVGRLDRPALLAATQDGWAVWQEPDPTDGGSGMGLARA